MCTAHVMTFRFWGFRSRFFEGGSQAPQGTFRWFELHFVTLGSQRSSASRWTASFGGKEAVVEVFIKTEAKTLTPARRSADFLASSKFFWARPTNCIVANQARMSLWVERLPVGGHGASSRQALHPGPRKFMPTFISRFFGGSKTHKTFTLDEFSYIQDLNPSFKDPFPLLFVFSIQSIHAI